MWPAKPKCLLFGPSPNILLILLGGAAGTSIEGFINWL